MRIGELARDTGISISRIRFYETRGMLAQPLRTANGYRSYGDDAADVLRFIDRAQRLGFSLAEIKVAMPDANRSTPSTSAIIAALLRKDAEIDQLLEATAAKKRAIAILLSELQCASDAAH